MLSTELSTVSCGNCGFPIAQAALDYKLYKYFVVELSSFQLKGIKKFAPKIAVITNIKQAHLDYHKGLEDYYKSKFNITKNQTKDDFIVLNNDDENSMVLFKNSDATKITYSLNNRNCNAYFNKNNFYYNKKKITNIRHLKNKSDMMKYNVLAAISVAKLLDISNKNIVKALKNFINIKYRLEEVYKDVFNDAKSTNIYSTISAIKEFSNKDIYLICGGFDRGEDLSPLDSYLDNITKVYAYGATKEKVQCYFKKRKISVMIFDTLKEAVIKSLNDKMEEIILYSPMFASYDQYSSFEERGKEFNRLIFNFYNTK